MNNLKLVVVCPFCGKEHEVRSQYRNLHCSCDAKSKFYVYQGLWLCRSGKDTGKKIYLTHDEMKALVGYIKAKENTVSRQYL